MPTGIRLKGQKIMNRLNIALTRRGLFLNYGMPAH